MGKKKESNYFRTAFMGGGTDASADCEYCGRTYFCSEETSSGYEDGEYEELAEKAKTNSLYVETTDSISYSHVNGKQYIWGCECCGVRPLENFLVENRSSILEYYRLRLEEQKQNLATNAKDFEPFKKR